MNFTLRRAQARDCRAIFDLSNQESVRKNSMQQNQIKWHEHCAWFERAIASNDLIFLIAETSAGELIGQVRFNIQHGENIVSISLNEAFRGQKLGQTILRAAMREANLPHFVAWVRAENLASLRLFLALGYVEIHTENETNLKKFVFKSVT